MLYKFIYLLLNTRSFINNHLLKSLCTECHDRSNIRNINKHCSSIGKKNRMRRVMLLLIQKSKVIYVYANEYCSLEIKIKMPYINVGCHNFSFFREDFPYCFDTENLHRCSVVSCQI